MQEHLRQELGDPCRQGLRRIWKEPEWRRVLSTTGVCETAIDQCAYGLVSPEGGPIKKPTKFVASDPCLIHFLDRVCPGHPVHVRIVGRAFDSKRDRWVSLSKWSQVWPKALCQAIANGYELLLERAAAQRGAPCALISDLHAEKRFPEQFPKPTRSDLETKLRVWISCGHVPT